MIYAILADVPRSWDLYFESIKYLYLFNTVNHNGAF